MSDSKNVVKASYPKFGKFSHHSDLRKFQAEKYSSDIRKKELEKQRHQKSATLRKYAKLCKAEGINSDRVNLGNKQNDEVVKNNVKKESKTYRPFSKAEAQAMQLENSIKEKELQREANLLNKNHAIKKREEKHKSLSKTNKKGQPILGNHIKSILAKLQKE